MNDRRNVMIIGLLLAVFGLLLRSVESFVLRPEATRLLANLTGPDPNSPQGAVRDLIVTSTAPRKVLTPPNWVGWFCLSLGFVLTAHSLMRRPANLPAPK